MKVRLRDIKLAVGIVDFQMYSSPDCSIFMDSDHLQTMKTLIDSLLELAEGKKTQIWIQMYENEGYMLKIVKEIQYIKDSPSRLRKEISKISLLKEEILKVIADHESKIEREKKFALRLKEQVITSLFQVESELSILCLGKTVAIENPIFE